MRDAAEIAALRAEAARMLRSAVTIKRLREIAQREVKALRDVLESMTQRRAVELGCSPHELSTSDVLVTDDDRAVARLFGRAALASNVSEPVDQDETLDHVVARLAIERGWNIMDAARAILADARAKVDDVRDGASHGIAKRVNAAVKQATRAQLRNVEAQLRMLETGTPTEAAAVLLPAVLLSVITNTEITVEDAAEWLRATRDRLESLLAGGGRRGAQSAPEASTV